MAYNRQIIAKHHKNQEVEKPLWVLPSPSGPMPQLVHPAHLPGVAGSRKGGRKPVVRDCLIPPPSHFQPQSLRVGPGSTLEPGEGSECHGSPAQPSTLALVAAHRRTGARPARLLGGGWLHGTGRSQSFPVTFLGCAAASKRSGLKPTSELKLLTSHILLRMLVVKKIK